ncbi:MAG TPA: hypothetical protein VGM78_04835 [Ilumatobacteraceae bacterium]|jgi:hypothetical protein
MPDIELLQHFCEGTAKGKMVIVSVSSTAFCRFLSTHPAGQVAVVKDARSRIGAHLHLREQNDPWRSLRALSVRYLCGPMPANVYRRKAIALADTEGVPEFRPAAEGLIGWRDRNPVECESVTGRTWTNNGLTIVVNPDVVFTANATNAHVVALYFGAQPLTKSGAQPMLRLLERTHGPQGVAAVLDCVRGKLHAGPTASWRKLDSQLSSEAAVYVELWNSIEQASRESDRPAL